MVTYYSRFIPDVSTITYPLRKLLIKDSTFRWTKACEDAFLKLKNEISSDRILTPYNPELPLVITCDASPTGVAGMLSHVLNGIEKPIAFASRSLTSAERNYSQLDREALAIVFAINHFFMYVFGRKFKLITDNQPLASIHQEQYSTDIAINEEVHQLCYSTIFEISTEELTTEKIVQETDKDEVLSKIKQTILNGEIDNIEYTLDAGILFKGQRAVIPKKLQAKILEELHKTHVGITKMKQLARRYCIWKGIDRDIENTVKSCRNCAEVKASPAKAPVHHWEEPTSNWDRIHIDYAGPFENHYFLIVIDARSRWAEIRITKDAPTSEKTIELLKDIFSIHGFPKAMVSDNATIFVSETFKQFCRNSGIFQKLIAPGHPATNGLAERNVQTLKQRLKSMQGESLTLSQKVREILFKYRATPLACGKSPAELYLHRAIRINLDILKPLKNTANYQEIPGTRNLSIGERVQARYYTNQKPVWKFGTVIKKFGQLHYHIKLDNGCVFKRHID
ncbi:Uncharacterized protein K02A2.6 [Cyphomyrmex costatus]|uniref:RNA-directed DNA polymerase n=1 Tax=Cyphomyrmex costatus TaxID=456900 RepID=A0A151IKM1_9HYME|nr:Uncharacterized protein K02A2.6 [Cyphomyrmex costatus]